MNRMALTEEEKKQKRREYDAKWKRDNRERIKANMTEEQKASRKEYARLYNEKNKQKRKEFYRVHNQKPEIKKARKINEWKRRGLITEDYDAIHTKWSEATHCEDCNINFDEATTINYNKCMDHCHATGEFRAILCHPCNIRRDA